MLTSTLEMWPSPDQATPLMVWEPGSSMLPLDGVLISDFTFSEVTRSTLASLLPSVAGKMR